MHIHNFVGFQSKKSIDALSGPEEFDSEVIYEIICPATCIYKLGSDSISSCLLFVMPPKKLEGVKIHIEHSLLSSSLGSLVSEALQQLDAEVDGAAHPIEYTITWEPRGDAHVLVILDESTPFHKHAEEMYLHFSERRITYLCKAWKTSTRSWCVCRRQLTVLPWGQVMPKRPHGGSLSC